MRIERDFLGEKELPDNALYGIHALRAKENFPDKTPFHQEWFKAIAIVKLACYQTYKNFKDAVEYKYPSKKDVLNLFSGENIQALIESAEELSEGKLYEHIVVPAVQGGAGTSINMNINEIIANRSLQKLGEAPGKYNRIDPFEHANVFQSTNDVIPTALKVAAMKLLEELEESINEMRTKVEQLEQEHRNNLRIGYTQMQEAVPSSYGKLFSTYNEAFSRDWWRVSKCFERIKVVNLGGSAIGTGISVPSYFIMEVVPVLQKLTGLPVTRSENLPDTTSNLDSFVEVHSIMKSHAVNLEKMVSDIRLLASDLINRKEVSIPQVQAGSSIMPGKVNPVIPEYVISVVNKVYSNDALISSLAGKGNLDLNAYLPIIGHALLDSLKLLIGADKTIKDNLISELKVYPRIALERLYNSPSVTTALSPVIGYNKASELAKLMKDEELDVFKANKKLNFLSEQKLETILKPSGLLKMGYQIKDLLDDT
ncbi:MAG: lyase family protein [Bacteroidota bacterium]